MIRALVLVVAAATITLSAQSRDTAPLSGTASIAGVVIAAADKQPIGYARVTLNDGVRITYTNAKGEFLMPKLSPGRYAISVQASGYLPMSLGQTRPYRPGVAQVLATGEERKGVVLAMHKGGVVSGHVVGPDGRPLSGVNVWTLQKRWHQDGAAYFDISGQGRTDDRGDYRVPALTAGTYLVEVLPPSIIGREGSPAIDETQRLASEGMFPTFYPGTVDPALAISVAVDVDTERAGVDFNIQATPIWTVSGRVDGVVAGPMKSTRPGGETNGQVNAGAVRLRPSAQAPGGLIASSDSREPFARVNPDGRFRFEAVPAGQYELLYSRGSDSTTRALYGASSVTVTDRDVEDATVAARPAAGVFGEILAAPPVAKPAATPAFGLVPIGGMLAPYSNFLLARTDEPGTFAINDLAPGRYALRPSPSSAGTYVSRLEVDGAAVVGTLIEIGASDLKNVRVTYRTDVAEVSGHVRHEDLTPVTEYALVVFPSDKREWAVWMTGAGVSRPDSSGHYSYSIRPGSYLIAAVDDVDSFQWMDPVFLESLIPTATKVTLGPGQKLSQDFVVK